MAKGNHAGEAQAFAHRLKEALADAGIAPSATVVANEFNLRYWGRSITSHTARSWLQGISIPMQDKLRALAEWLQVSPDELRFGTAAPVHRVAEPLAGEAALSLQDRQMLSHYLALAPESRKTVRDVVTALHEAAVARQARPR